MVQASTNPFEGSQQQQLAAAHIDEPMSENCTRARRWLAEHFQPYICVFSSKNTQRRMMEVNGLTPAEFLRPFGEVGNLSNYLVRTCDKNMAYKLNRFRVNFVDSHLMSDHPKPADRIPERIINEHKPKVGSEMAHIASSSSKGSKEAINATLQGLIGVTRFATERTQTPWFTQMKQHLYQTNRFAQHELTQQPIAFVYFLSVEDKDPLAAIDRLRNAENLPRQYRTGIYDNSKTNLKQFVLVLNDTPGEARYQTVQQQVCSQFADSIVHEIKMSASEQSPGPQNEYWERYLDLDIRAFDRTAGRVVQCGALFSQNDRTQAQQIIRRVIEKTLIPFSVQRIQAIEANIAKTRKGISKFFRVFKSSERGENDGMASNFRMNRSELELRTLTDLSFVIQDYETTYSHAEYPSNDFKRTKAHLHAAHCDEIKLYARIAHDKFYAQTNMKDVVATANGIYDLYSKGMSAHANSSQSLIRFSLMMAELFQCFGEHGHAADFFVRLANKLADKAILKAMCFEQAAYEYLMLQQFRKFSYFMTLAGQSYERMGQRDLKFYSFNCFTIVHPFYQARSGWNTIQYQLYSLLGANSEIAEGNSQLAVQFFRNLLLLTHQFNDVNQQRQCLTASLQAFRKFQQDEREDQDKGSNIGYLQLPEILPHTIEVFVDHEKVLTNLKESKIPIVSGGSYCDKQGECNLIEQKFINFNGFYRDESMIDAASKEAKANGNSIVNEDINQSNIPWRILEKQVTEYCRKNHQSELEAGSEGCYAVNGDEMTECGIYDANCLKERTDTTYKRQRKVYKDKAIRVRFMLRNPLLTDISISNLRLCCRYVKDSEEGEKKEENGDEEEKDEEEEFKAEHTEMQLPSQEQIEVILKVVPYKTGNIVIEQIRWELYDIFKCEYDLNKSEATKSDVRPEFRSILPRQLVEKEKIFNYQVLPPSAEISAKIELQNNGSLPRLGQQSRLVFSETDTGMLHLKNLSSTHSIRNIYLLCSHPIVFDLYIKRLARDEMTGEALELGPGEEVQIPINFRASLKGDFSVRFLFRYEVIPRASEVLPATCRFRFQRLIMFINSQCLFAMNPVVHMSLSEPDQYIVNLMTLQKLSTTWYERPAVSTIETIRGARRWILNKKDSLGNFFTVKPRTEIDEIKDDLPGAQLAYLRQSQFAGDVLEGLNRDQVVDMDSLTKDHVAFTFMTRESDHMENTTGKKWRKTEGDAENEQIDLVVRWSMQEKGKTGFITLFGVQLLREKKILTTMASKIIDAQQVLMQRAIRQSVGARQNSSRSQSSTRRETLSNQKVMPIKVTYEFPQQVTHLFSEGKPSKMVNIVLKVQNLLQSDDLCKFSVEVSANQSWKKGKGRYSLVDVSEGESFLWVGKTSHKLQNFKLNETKRVVLRANLPRQGLFNLNRFSIIVKQLDNAVEQREMLVSEYRVRDALMVQVQDPMPSEVVENDQLLLQLSDNAPYEFSK